MLSQAFCQGSLTYPRVPNKDRVILLTTADDLQHALDFLLAAHHWVHLALLGHLSQVAGKGVQGWRLAWRSLAGFLGPRLRLALAYWHLINADSLVDGFFKGV